MKARERAAKARRGSRGQLGKVSKGAVPLKQNTARDSRNDMKSQVTKPTEIATQARRRPVKQGMLAKGKAAK